MQKNTLCAAPPLSWSHLSRWRKECYQRFGTIHQLPIRDINEESNRVLQHVTRVLDIGAGVDKAFRTAITSPQQQYFSMDSDPSGYFDFT